MAKPHKTTSRSALARELLTQGAKPKDVARRTGLSIQTVYTVRWKMANKQGLGAIKPATPKAQKTGIAAIPPEFDLIDRSARKKQANNRRNAQLARYARERQQREMRDIISTLQPKRQSIWQRIKGFFVGA